MSEERVKPVCARFPASVWQCRVPIDLSLRVLSQVRGCAGGILVPPKIFVVVANLSGEEF